MAMPNFTGPRSVDCGGETTCHVVQRGSAFRTALGREIERIVVERDDIVGAQQVVERHFGGRIADGHQLDQACCARCLFRGIPFHVTRA